MGFSFVNVVWGAVAVVAMASCVSLEEIAPPVSGAMATAPVPILAQGRHLYVTKCARCHAPEPIRNFTLAQWEPILIDMAEQTKLSDEETRAVRLYIEAVSAIPPQ